MNPNINPSLPPPFWQLDPVDQFQPLCSDLLSEDEEIAHSEIYGVPGQRQLGIDILADSIRDGVRAVAQCKCYENFDEGDLDKACEEFEDHLEHWLERGVDRFIVMVACAANRTQVVEGRLAWRRRFRERGVTFELWDGYKLRQLLVNKPVIAGRHITSMEVVENICGKRQLEPNLMVQTEELPAQISLAMREPERFRSHIEKAVLTEAKAVWQLMSTQTENCSFLLSPSDGDACRHCFKVFERGSQRLVTLLTVIVRHDEHQAFAPLVGSALKILARDPRILGQRMIPGILGVRLYPLSLAIYALCIVAVEWRRPKYIQQLSRGRWQTTLTDTKFTNALDALWSLVRAKTWYQQYSDGLRNSVCVHALVMKSILGKWLPTLVMEWDEAWWIGELVLGIAGLNLKSQYVFPSTYLYAWDAVDVLTLFLQSEQTFLSEVFPDIAERLSIFDQLAPGTLSGMGSSSEGFYSGSLAAFKQTQ
jgi:hypothetical protein